MNKEDIRQAWKKTWNFLWHEDSLLSWIVSLILAFLIIKFVFFPLLSLLMGTSLPMVVVESGSMHHPGSVLGNLFQTSGTFSLWWSQSGSWYEDKNITKADATSWPLRNGLEIGDIVLVWGHSKPEVGDIIIFNARQTNPIIHRIINISIVNNETVYSTKGDNNAGQLEVEKVIPKDAIIGKALVRIPWLGWIKLFFVKLANFF